MFIALNILLTLEKTLSLVNSMHKHDDNKALKSVLIHAPNMFNMFW